MPASRAAARDRSELKAYDSTAKTTPASKVIHQDLPASSDTTTPEAPGLHGNDLVKPDLAAPPQTVSATVVPLPPGLRVCNLQGDCCCHKHSTLLW